ncbi:MAG TPA: universal stress protein [Thermomicrobiales bacterium]|nr:universal stress protein [Thermomicrobiales bacterium]
MSHTVLAPLDGSPLAERALPFAEALARPAGGCVVLVRAVPFLSRPAGDEPFPTLAAAQDAAAREARDYLDAVAARLAGRGVAVDVATPCEDEAEGILGEAERRGADLIAMATHGRGGLRRLVYGSVAEEVLARATTPTLVVRAWVPTGGAALLGDHPRLLVPLDGSADAAAALPVAAALADELDGTLLLMRAVARPDLAFAPDLLAAPLLRQELAEERAAAEDYLRALADRYARAGRAVETVVRVGRPGLEMAAAVIEAVGRERGAALVVMASHRYRGLDRLLLGSVADATLRHGTLPVLLVRPPRAPEEGGAGPA